MVKTSNHLNSRDISILNSLSERSISSLENLIKTTPGKYYAIDLTKKTGERIVQINSSDLFTARVKQSLGYGDLIPLSDYAASLSKYDWQKADSSSYSKAVKIANRMLHTPGGIKLFDAISEEVQDINIFSNKLKFEPGKNLEIEDGGIKPFFTTLKWNSELTTEVLKNYITAKSGLHHKDVEVLSVSNGFSDENIDAIDFADPFKPKISKETLEKTMNIFFINYFIFKNK